MCGLRRVGDCAGDGGAGGAAAAAAMCLGTDKDDNGTGIKTILSDRYADKPCCGLQDVDLARLPVFRK